MVRILVEHTFVDGKKYIEGACVAADVAGLRPRAESNNAD